MFTVRMYKEFSHSPMYQFMPLALAELMKNGFGDLIPYGPSTDAPALIAFAPSPTGEYAKPVGMLVYRYMQMPSTWWIDLSWVKPEFRRQGVHTLMFQTLVARARKRGDIRSIDCGTHITNTVAQAAFESQGRFQYAINYRYIVNPDLDGADPLEIEK